MKKSVFLSIRLSFFVGAGTVETVTRLSNGLAKKRSGEADLMLS
jgi:hypothetical protein